MLTIWINVKIQIVIKLTQENHKINVFMELYVSNATTHVTNFKSKANATGINVNLIIFNLLKWYVPLEQTTAFSAISEELKEKNAIIYKNTGNVISKIVDFHIKMSIIPKNVLIFGVKFVCKKMDNLIIK